MIFLFFFLLLVRCLSYILHVFIFNDISNTSSFFKKKIFKKKEKKNFVL